MTAEWTAGDGGTLRLFGTPAAGRDARQVVDDVIAEAFPDAAVAYELPNATAGYQLGYGVAADFAPPNRSDPLRVMVIAAVKNDLALVAVAEGRSVSSGRVSGPVRRHRRTCR